MSFAALCLLPALIAGQSSAQQEAVQKRLSEIFAGANVPGISACVIMPDGTEILVAVGTADEEGTVPMTSEHRFLSGSSGKMHFAVFAMQMMLEGKIKLDDQVRKYLGKEEWYGKFPGLRGTKLRHLMHHTSGVPEHVQSPTFVPALMNDPLGVWRPEELLSHNFGLKPHFAPGKGWSYADTNFILLTMAVEKASGKGAYEVIKETQLVPLGLTMTEPSVTRRFENLANGRYAARSPFGQGWSLVDGQLKLNPQFEWAGGGFVSSPRDLARFTHDLLTGNVLPMSAVEEMTVGVPARTGRNHEYGLGLMIRPSALGRSYGHAGYMPGYITDVQHFPNHGITASFQMNTDDARALGMNYQSVVVELAKAALTSS